MTTAQAQAVAADLLAGGYSFNILPRDGGGWTVVATAPLAVAAPDADAFAAQHGVAVNRYAVATTVVLA